MSCDSECWTSQVASPSNQIVEEFRRGSKISYSRDYLLSLPNVNPTKELPSGIDRSNLSELDNSASKHRQLLGLKSPCTGRKPGDSSIGSSERWGSCKLRSTDSKSADYRKFYSSQSPHSWKNPGFTANLRSTPNSEHDGILGSWSASKLPSAGSKVPTLKLPGTDSCLLSRCKESYRPPSFYKAMYSGGQNHNTLSNETSGCAKCPSKERAMEENWRKDTCQVPEEDSIVPAITNKQNPSLYNPAVSGSAESPCFAGEASDKYCADHQPPLQDLVVQQLPSNTQLLKKDFEVEVDVEKFDGQIMEGWRFSSLINLKEAEDIDSYFLDEANVASNGSYKDGQSVKEKKELKNHVDNSCKSKETRIGDTPHVNATRSSAVDVPISFASSAGPSYRACLQSASVDQNWKSINATAKDVHKTCASVPLGPEHSKVRSKGFDGFTPEIGQSSPCTKNYGNIVDGRSSSRSDSRFMHWFPENDISHSIVISSGAEKDGRKLWGVSTKKPTSNLVGQGKPRGPLTHRQKAQFSKSTCAKRNTCYPDGFSHHAPNVQESELDTIVRRNQDHCTSRKMSDFQIADEADNSLLIDLSDEDSLIAVDETYILKQDKLAQSSEFSLRGARKSSFPVPYKLIGSEIIQQNFSSPEPCFHESQLNSWNSSDSLAPDFSFKDNPFAAVSSPPGLVPLKPQKVEPSVEDFLSHRTPQAYDYCHDLDNILSAEPSVYDQLFQTPCCNQELNTRRSLPLNYRSTVNSTMGGGKRGLFAEERNMSTISQYLQMRRKLAQINSEAAEQRAYSEAACYLIRLFAGDASSSAVPQGNNEQGGEQGNNEQVGEEGESVGSNVVPQEAAANGVPAADIEPVPGAAGPGPGPVLGDLRPFVLIFSSVFYQHHLRLFHSMAVVGIIYADDLMSWEQLELRLRAVYLQVAEVDPEIVSAWPWRIIHYNCQVGLEWIERRPLLDDWHEAGVANNLREIWLQIPPRDCRVLVIQGGEGQMHEMLIGQLNLTMIDSWHALALQVRSLFFANVLFLQDDMAAIDQINPINCCPNATVTYWTDLKERLFWTSTWELQENPAVDQNWSYVQRSLFKIKIYW